MGKYDDILFETPPVSDKRSRMKRSDRAKQFAPFAALKGYEEAIKAQEQQYVPPVVLSETSKAEINRILNQLQRGDKVVVDYHRNGAYHTVNGVLLKADMNRRVLIFEGCEVGFGAIKSIRVDGISDFDEGC